MKTKSTILVAIAIASITSILAYSETFAQTKSERCAAYAHDAARSTPTTTGSASGAARGAATAAILGGDAATGAVAGAVIGGTRRAAQRRRSYQAYYNECMRRR
jgi:hypothetical protein